jgi:glycosyltransferase involved in cell wall biosynthesis
MSPAKKITVLIPAYNEATQIGDVLSVMTKLDWVNQIIVVDDGSTDGTVSLIKKKFPVVHCLQLSKNLGKTAALQVGSFKIDTFWTLLFDADIWDFELEDLTKAWKKVSAHSDLTSVILQTATDPWLWKILKLDILLSGQRFIQTKKLQQFFKTIQPYQYDFELAFTRWCFEQAHQIGWISFKSRNYFKLQKWSWPQAILKSLSFYSHWLRPVGIREISWQRAQLKNGLIK